MTKLTIDCEDGYLTIVEGGQQGFTLFVIEDRHGGETVVSLSEDNLEEVYQFIKEIL